MDLLTDHLQPGRIFFRNKEYDPQTIMAGIDSVSRYLSENLVSKSPFVYLFATNHIKTVFSYFGIIKARRICVIMDPKIGPLELEEKLLDTPPAACIHIDKATEAFDFSKEIEVRNPPWKDEGPDDLSDVCTMIYTAAEDGYAKAVMLTHENMLSNARAVVEGNNVVSKSVTYALLPSCHLYALQVGIIIPNMSGSTTIINEESDFFRPGIIKDCLHYNKITHLYSIPVVYLLMSKIKNLKKTISNVKCINSGGYSLSDEIRERIFNKFPFEIREGYGLSEASPVCTLNSQNEPYKTGSVGRALNCCKVKIVTDNHNETLNHQKGEIVIQGSNVMKGYYNQTNSTQMILVNNWLHTGDWGRIDEEGYLIFLGIKKRMINYGGGKVYPAEVERLISKNNNVRNVQIYGYDDAVLGQKINAKIQLIDNSINAQEKIKLWCRQSITEYKLPARIEFVQ